LAEDAIIAAIGDRPVLIVDECRRTGGQAEAIMALMQERGVSRFARLTAEDSFIATGPAYAATLPSREGIVAASRALLEN
jgi:2-oxoisovalerate dehydrogenase E1 component